MGTPALCHCGKAVLLKETLFTFGGFTVYRVSHEKGACVLAVGRAGGYRARVNVAGVGAGSVPVYVKIERKG